MGLDKHLPLDMVQYEIEHLAVTKNTSTVGLSCEHGSRAEGEGDVQKAYPDCRLKKIISAIKMISALMGK